MQKTVLILHGWGLSGERYSELQEILTNHGFQVFSPDFPGFGKEPLIKSSMTIDDYVVFLEKFYIKNKITKAYIVAHSFGGRVTAKFAVKNSEKIEKIVFTGTPLIRQELSWKKQIIHTAAHMTKRWMSTVPKNLQKKIQWIVYRSIGEWDYYKADKMRETFKNVISEDASVYIADIKNPVLTLWGKDDTITPVFIGRQISARIPGSKFVTIADAGHKVPYSHPKKFAQQVISFFNS